MALALRVSKTLLMLLSLESRHHHRSAYHTVQDVYLEVPVLYLLDHRPAEVQSELLQAKLPRQVGCAVPGIIS